MNQNLLYIVARHNVDRIYGDLRFDHIDDDFTEAVVSVGATLPGREPDHDPAVRAPKSRSKRVHRISKVKELADRLRKEKA
jgi:hypothetical protein